MSEPGVLCIVFDWRKSIPRCRRINRMLSNESLHPPAFSRSNSEASVDSASMEDFWREIESDEEEDGKALLSTLTRTQAAAVQKRYHTYTQTMRKKDKQSIRDVRDIFGVSESPPRDTCGNHTNQLDGTKEERELPRV
ncbi:Rho GTPase activating protein 28, partial [Homo sapiens]